MFRAAQRQLFAAVVSPQHFARIVLWSIISGQPHLIALQWRDDLAVEAALNPVSVHSQVAEVEIFRRRRVAEAQIEAAKAQKDATLPLKRTGRSCRSNVVEAIAARRARRRCRGRAHHEGHCDYPTLPRGCRMVRSHAAAGAAITGMGFPHAAAKATEAAATEAATAAPRRIAARRPTATRRRARPR